MMMAGRFCQAAGKQLLIAVTGIRMHMAGRFCQAAGKHIMLLIAGIGVGVPVRFRQGADELLLLLIAGIGVLMGDSAFFNGADELLLADDLIAFIRVGVLFKAAEGLLTLGICLQCEQNTCQAYDKSTDTAKERHTALCALL